MRDEEGKLVELRDKSLPYKSTGHTGKQWDKCSLESGKSRDLELIISFRYDLSKPGKYKIQLLRRSNVDSNGVRGGEWVKSNIITITVVGPETPSDDPK